MEDGNPPDKAVAKHGIMHLQQLERHSNGLEQASERVWDGVPDGEPCPQLEIGHGVLRVRWHGWSLHNDNTSVWHHVLAGEGDASESLPFHLPGVRVVSPLPPDDLYLIIMVIGGRVGFSCSWSSLLRAQGLAWFWVGVAAGWASFQGWHWSG